tara:strand:+ start:648 stop:1064 length:417 start_codon:yes stop_codon:yes gene_type:complete
LGFVKDVAKDIATGVVVGLIIGDEEYQFPIDMVAIPAFQMHMLQGTPSMQVYIKAGETLVPTGGNVADMNENMEIEAPGVSEKPKKKRKRSKWNSYVKKKANHIKFKSGKMKGRLDLKKMAKEFAKKEGKKAVKKLKR